jgi:L-alanine-DL-glutamate epimerase-like enolase superfamily enzyme
MHGSYKRRPDGKYTIGGKVFERLVGSRAQVWHQTAYKTSGGLTRAQLVMNKHGRVVSAKKHMTAKREKRLVKHGYTAKKGKFGAVKIGSSVRKTRKSRK